MRQDIEVVVTQQDRDMAADYWSGLGQDGSAMRARDGTGFAYTAEMFAYYRTVLTQ